MNQAPAEDKAATPVRKDIPVTKGKYILLPVTPIFATRPKRVIKPVRDNIGLV